jgi:hypothetical protein
MRGTAALKSIEALYKEAEIVIGDGVPMVAIVKSVPPMAKPDIPVAERPTAIPTNTPIDNNPIDNTPIDNTGADTGEISGTDLKAEAQTAIFDRIEMLRSMAAILEEDKVSADTDNNDPAPISATPDNLSGHPADATPADVTTADVTTADVTPADVTPSGVIIPSLPDAPPVPAYQSGSRQISDADLEDVVKRAIADIIAVTPLENVVAGNDRIESVMADIAEAVGKAGPATTSENANNDGNNTGNNDGISATQINLDDLNDSVARTVKSVIREELSILVQSTVKTTLAELRATHDDKAKSQLYDRPSD